MSHAQHQWPSSCEYVVCSMQLLLIDSCRAHGNWSLPQWKVYFCCDPKFPGSWYLALPCLPHSSFSRRTSPQSKVGALAQWQHWGVMNWGVMSLVWPCQMDGKSLLWQLKACMANSVGYPTRAVGCESWRLPTIYLMHKASLKACLCRVNPNSAMRIGLSQ